MVVCPWNNEDLQPDLSTIFLAEITKTRYQILSFQSRQGPVYLLENILADSIQRGKLHIAVFYINSYSGISEQHAIGNKGNLIGGIPGFQKIDNLFDTQKEGRLSSS